MMKHLDGWVRGEGRLWDEVYLLLHSYAHKVVMGIYDYCFKEGLEQDKKLGKCILNKIHAHYKRDVK